MKKQLPDILVGVVLATALWVLYMVTLSRGAVPGPSARLVLSALDLFPRMMPQAPLWHLLVTGLVRVSGMHAVYVLNAFSAFCAAVAVGLLYAVMRNGIIQYLDRYLLREARARFVAALAGFVAAAGLGLSAPFWSVANRAHMMSFDIMLLLLAAWLLVSFIKSGHFVYLVVLTLSYGLFAAEFATMIVVGPLFALGVLYGLWRHERLLPRWLGLLSGLLLVGIVSGYFFAAWIFYISPGYVLRNYDGFWGLLWAIWRDQAVHISRSLPREGWLIILFTTTVPWLAMFAVARRGLNDDRDKALILLHMIMTVFAGALWLHVPLTPWRLMGWQRLLITPYVLTAMVSGYLVAFWFLFAREWRVACEAGWKGWLQFLAGWVVVLALFVQTVFLPWWFADEAQPEGRNVHMVAKDVVESLDGRTWLISDGLFDAHYYLAAWEQGLPLRILSLPSGNQAIYQRYIAGFFDDVRLQNAAMLSLYALLQEWLVDPAAAQDVAILHDPDLWRRLGYEAVPQRMVYTGVLPDALQVDMQDAQSAVGFMDALGQRLSTVAATDAISEQVSRWTRSHAARLGNDLGVLLEDANLDTKAHAVYVAARRLDPDNISVLLNLASMISDARADDPGGQIMAALDALENALEERLQIWSLSRTYGTVRAPEAFAQMGWNWAYSGQARLAVSQVERATALQGEGRSPAMEALMAEVYLLDNRPIESAAIYRRMMADDAQRMMGLAGLYRLALRMERLPEARSILARMADAGMPGERVVLEEVMLDLLDGRAEAALARLDDFLIENRGVLRGWVLMAEAGFSIGDERRVNRALRRIEMLEGARGYYTSLIRARMAFRANDYSLAADLYETALGRRPGHLPLIEELLRLHLFLQRRDAAEKHMRALLHADPAHALALYVRGSLQIADENYRLAEDSLRRSLASERSLMVLNDLAWLLTQREVYEEAEELVREALAINEVQPAAWSTLGGVLMRTGRLDEAEAAFSRSISLGDANAMVHLQLAEVQILRGRLDAAREIVEQFDAYRGRLNDAERAYWQRLREAVR